MDDEIDRAFAEERERKVLAVIPLNLDGYLLSGKAKPVLSRLAANFSSCAPIRLHCRNRSVSLGCAG